MKRITFLLLGITNLDFIFSRAFSPPPNPGKKWNCSLGHVFGDFLNTPLALTQRSCSLFAHMHIKTCFYRAEKGTPARGPSLPSSSAPLCIGKMWASKFPASFVPPSFLLLFNLLKHTTNPTFSLLALHASWCFRKSGDPNADSWWVTRNCGTVGRPVSWHQPEVLGLRAG